MRWLLVIETDMTDVLTDDQKAMSEVMFGRVGKASDVAMLWHFWPRIRLHI